MLNFKKALVVGLGVSGRSAICALQKFGIDVCYYDDSLKASDSDIENRSEYPLHKIFDDIDVVIVSPGIDNDSTILKNAVKYNKKIISEVELGYLINPNNMIAITGTNGKTTTTLLTAAILREYGVNAYECGNIGIPYSEIALQCSLTDIPVVEVSSFQLEHVHDLKPKAAVLLNISSDHIERHKTFDAYVESKMKLFHNMDKNDIAIFNYDDPICRELSKEVKANVFYFSLQQAVRGCFVDKDKIYFCDSKKEAIAPLKIVKMKGRHNLENSLAAATFVKTLNFGDYGIKKQLSEFLPPRHRVEYIAKIGHINYYNDSKGTNIGATIAGCQMMEGSTALIMGGYDKGLDYDEFFNILPPNINYIFVTGANEQTILDSAKRCNFQNIFAFEDLDECVREASKTKVENVLYSPSTSSFDRYSSYKERGIMFCKTVKKMLEL